MYFAPLKIRSGSNDVEGDLLEQGLELMLAGMGTVFVFLTVLVVAMSLMSGIALRFSRSTPPSGASDEEVAAITAAIALHRNKKN